MACEGIDFDFVDEPAKDLYCIICSCLIKQATLLNCGHVLCKLCLDRYVECSKQRNVKLECPLRCNKEILPIVPVPLVDRLISALTINCEKKNVGCEWKGELSNVQDHLKKSCGFREVSCENCDAHIFNKDLQNHIADCPIVICSNKCGEKMSRDEAWILLNTCPMQLMECPFKDVGCKVSVLRRSVSTHMEENTNTHMLLLLADGQRNKAEIDSLSVELDTCRVKIAAQEAEIDSFKVELDACRVKIAEQEAEIDSFKVELDACRVKIAAQEAEIDSFKVELDACRVKIAAQEAEIDSFKVELDACRVKIAAQEAEKKETKETGSKIKQATLPQPTTLPKITPETQNHLDQQSQRGLRFIIELLRNKNISLSTFELLLTHNPHIIDMRSDNNNTTIIHYAADFNRADVLALLLSVDTSHIDDVNDYNNTALMLAVVHNHIECVRVLLANNADVTIKNCFGNTPLSLAREEYHVDIIRLLEKHRKQHRTARR